MKKIIILVFFILLLTSCNSKEASKKIIGTWQGENELRVTFNKDLTFTLTCLNYKCDNKLVKEYIYEDDRRLEPCTISGTYKIENNKLIYLYQTENTCNSANDKKVTYTFNNDLELICLDDTAKCSIGLTKENEDNA